MYRDASAHHHASVWVSLKIQQHYISSHNIYETFRLDLFESHKAVDNSHSLKKYYLVRNGGETLAWGYALASLYKILYANSEILSL